MSAGERSYHGSGGYAIAACLEVWVTEDGGGVVAAFVGSGGSCGCGVALDGPGDRAPGAGHCPGTEGRRRDCLWHASGAPDGWPALSRPWGGPGFCRQEER